MSLATRIESLVIRVAQEFKNVRATAGNIANLSTTDKSSLVAAINELMVELVCVVARGAYGSHSRWSRRRI